MRIFRRYNFLFVLFCFFLSSIGSSENHQSSSTAKRGQASTNEKKVEIPTDACSEKDFFKYSGPNSIQRRYDPDTYESVKEEPSLPLFEQFITTKPNPDYRPPSVGWGTPASAMTGLVNSKLPSPILTSFQNRLHSSAVENFETLFKHSLSCLQKGNSEFLDTLHSTVYDSLYTREEPPNFSQFFLALFDVAKKEKKEAPEGITPQLKEAIDGFLVRLNNLKVLSEYEASQKTDRSRSLLPTLGAYLSNPKASEALSQLTSKIHSNPSGKENREPAHVELLTQLVSNIVSDPGLSAYLRQKFLFGNQSALFNSGTNQTSPPSPSEDVVGTATQELRSFSPAIMELREKLSEGLSGTGTAREEALWSAFQKQIMEETEKLTPAERTRIRESLIRGLQQLDHKAEKTALGMLKTAESREALLRAAHALELTIPNPAFAALPIEKRKDEARFTKFTSVLTEHQRNSHGLSRAAQQQLGVTIPLKSQNAIAETDPLILSFTQRADGKFHDNEQTRQFFQTGHSTTLFDLSDPSQGKIITAKVSDALKISGALRSWSDEEKGELNELLSHAVGGSKKGSVSNWDKKYEKIRTRLLGSLSDSTDDKAKAAALAIEMIDSTGNHGVNAYSNPLSDTTKDHYQVRNVLDRLREEKRVPGHTQSEAEQRLRHLLGEGIGIPARARISEAARVIEPGSAHEGRLLELYEKILTKDGRQKLSEEEAVVLKGLAFSNPGAEKLIEQNNLLIPGFRELEALQGLQEGILPSNFLETAPKLFLADHHTQRRLSELIESLRAASRSNQTDDRAADLSALSYIDELSRQPGMAAAKFLTQSFEEGDPRRADAADLMATLAPIFASEPSLAKKLDALSAAYQKRNQILQGAKRSNADYDYDIDEHLPLVGTALDGLSRLRAQVGSSAPTGERYLADTRSKFAGNIEKPIEDLVSRATTDHILKNMDGEKARKRILQQFGSDGLEWDSSIGAFELTEKTRLSTQLLKALEGSSPDSKFVWRDSRKPNEETIETLTDLRKHIFHRDQDLTLAGLRPRPGEWFPIEGNNTTAARWIEKNGTLELEFGDLKELRGKMEERLRAAGSLKSDVARAISEFGSFSHGAKDVLLNPFGLGYDPSKSKEDKALLDSRNRFTQARMELGEFGLLSVNGLTRGRHLLDEFLEFEKFSSENTRNAIQSYVNNAELTAEMAFAAGTLPFSFLGAANAATKAASATRLGYLLAESANAARTVGSAAHLARNFAALSAGTQAVWNAQSLTMGDAELRRISSAVQSGKEWRKFPTPPDPSKYTDQKQLDRDYTAWFQEKRWDLNQNGKPDFLEEDLKDFAFKGDMTPFRIAAGATKTYKSVFGMALTGELVPAMGFVGHIAVPSLAEKEVRYFTKAGREGDMSHALTQLDIAKEVGMEVGPMIPAMVLPGAVMRKMPVSLQKPINLFKMKTTTELAGASAFVAGSVGTHAAVNYFNGGNPWEALQDPASLFVNGYIGLGIAKRAAFHEAQQEILKMPEIAKPSSARATPRLGESGSSMLSTRVNPGQGEKAFWDSLVKKYGTEVVDSAAIQLREAPPVGEGNLNALGNAAQYLRGRASELRQNEAQVLQDNPFRESSLEQLQSRLVTLQGELAGAKGASLLMRDPRGFQQKSAELKQVKQATTAKASQYALNFAAQELEVSHALQQTVSDGISKPRSQREWTEIIESSSPELRPMLQELQQISSETIPTTQRWSEPIRSAASESNIVGDLLRTIVDPRVLGPSPTHRAERAADILGQLHLRTLSGTETPVISQYVHARFNQPQIVERLASQMGIDSSVPRETLRPLQAEIAQRTARQFELYVRAEKPKPGETLDEVFARFISSNGRRLVGVTQ